MATLDVSRVLRNPRFKSPVTVYRRTYEVNDYGRTVAAETSETVQAVVQPARERDLERLPEGDRVAGTIKIYCETPLTVRADGRLPDEILWRGLRHIVKACDAWLYGPGFYVALAVPQAVQTSEADDDA